MRDSFDFLFLLKNIIFVEEGRGALGSLFSQFLRFLDFSLYLGFELDFDFLRGSKGFLLSLDGN